MSKDEQIRALQRPYREISKLEDIGTSGSRTDEFRQCARFTSLHSDESSTTLESTAVGRTTRSSRIGSLLALALVVVDVADGDTLAVQAGETKTVIRLGEMVAPERTQPYSQVSRRHLETLRRHAKTVEITPVDSARYGRTVAQAMGAQKSFHAPAGVEMSPRSFPVAAL